MPDSKTYRIRADIQNEEYVDINVNLKQDIDVFEFLSIKVDTENFYRLHTANYGCVAGRVLANNAIGVPNVKISIFIAADEDTKADSVLSYLYPYSNTMDTDSNGVRYNLLPEEQLFVCHQNVGTFPSKRMVLDDSNVFEIFDEYYKFTTTTNSAGDYMIFGVPVGTQILHMDVDLSDIGDLLSQRPHDMVYKGYNVNQFENANMFKKDTNLGTLTQIISQNESVNVHPFWGEAEEMGEVDSTGVRITRKDINLNYKFEPTCVFMGSLVTDEKSNGFTKRCVPTERMGKMDRLTTGEGTIEMIRKKPDGTVEEFSIMGNQLIDGNGTWCYQIPMNLDYVRTDEYGNIVPTSNPDKGLPTRAQVRFRFSLNDFASDYQNNHLTKMLVPNNPQKLEDMGSTYIFGTKTPDDEFRDLFWNKVYSVKSYIPRLQKSNSNREKRFSGVKAVNVNVGNNPIPYNNMRIDITFMFVLQCAIMHILIWIAGAVNSFLTGILGIDSCGVGKDIRAGFNNSGSCVTVGDGACPDLEDWYFAPKCSKKELGDKNPKTVPLEVTLKRLKEKEGDTEISDGKSLNSENSEDRTSVCLTNKIDYFIQCIEIALAQEYDVIQFDFYNDWMNGLLYIPRWFANIKKKRKYLFGLVGPKKTKVQACMESTVRYQRRYVQQCAVEYSKDSDGNFTKISSKRGCVDNAKKQKCHKGKGRKAIKILKNTSPGGGYIHDQQTLRGEYAYYFRPCDWYGGKKLNYFATDIILLGSLQKNDMDGIPQTFKELVSSSYQMPTNIAATNMDTIAYMYGSASDGTSICGKGTTILKTSYDIPAIRAQMIAEFPEIDSAFADMLFTEAFLSWIASAGTVMEEKYRSGEWTYDEYRLVKRMCEIIAQGTVVEGVDDVGLLPETFDAYSKWASTTDFANDTDNDEDEYEVTESSGIDWGYTGPGQTRRVKTTDKKGNVTYEDANFENSSYQPGGHFLGIACFNAESNIKSCVNLSRICEMGATMSQRQAVVRRNGNELVDNDRFLVPTGVISRDEISDTGFRAEFATLNHNGLATKLNPLTNRVEYDFISMIPVNFDGALSDYVTTGIPYNDIEGNTDTARTHGDREYTRTVETGNVDYYRFRLGLKEGESPDSRYMIVNGGKAALPMYNNSYYFYFGLHDGSTALDRLYKDFFASCPDLHEGNVAVHIETKGYSTCDTDGVEGWAKVQIIGISYLSDEEVKYELWKGKALYRSGKIANGSSSVEFSNLPVGNYEIVIKTVDFEDITKTFVISKEKPEFITDITVDVYDFTETKYDADTGDTEGRGYVLVSWTDGRIRRVFITSGGEEYDLTNGEPFYLWEGNVEYTIRAEYSCTEGGAALPDPVDIYTFVSYMPEMFDLIIGGSTDVTYNKTIKLPGRSENRWWEEVLSNTDDSEKTKVEKFFTEKAITFKGSLARHDSGRIDVVPKYGNPPYVINVDGNGEQITQGGSDNPEIRFSRGEAEGYSLSYESFFYPTKNAPQGLGYDVVGNTVKSNYVAEYYDANASEGSSRIPEDENEKLLLPSIYKPFFFRCLIFENYVAVPAEITYAMTVVNGTLYDNKFSKISVCSTDAENLSQTETVWWTKDGGRLDEFPITSNRGMLSRRTRVTYDVLVKENEPDNQRPVLPSLEMTETVRFVGDGGTPTTGVRYFLLPRVTANGTRQNLYENPDYSEKIREMAGIIGYDDGTSLKEGYDANGIYWSGSVTKAFVFELDSEGGYLVFDPSKELDRNKVFAGDVNIISDEDRKSDCFVFGVYDPWTVLGDAEFKAAQNHDLKYAYVPKDSSMLTILRVYAAKDFVRLMENPGIYVDQGMTDNDTEDNFFVTLAGVSDTVSSEPGDLAEISTVDNEKSVKVADIHIRNMTQVISVPELKVKFTGPPMGSPGMDFTLVFVIRNTSTGEEKKLTFKEPYGGEGVVGNVNSVSYVRTVATDIYAADRLGTGTYEVWIEYALSLAGTVGQPLNGRMDFEGGTLHITNNV